MNFHVFQFSYSFKPIQRLFLKIYSFPAAQKNYKEARLHAKMRFTHSILFFRGVRELAISFALIR